MHHEILKTMSRVKTLGQFIIEKQADFPFSKGELSRLLRDIGIASKIVNREVTKAGLADILGDAGEINIQGENVKKLDVFANEFALRNLRTYTANAWTDPYYKQSEFWLDHIVSAGCQLGTYKSYMFFRTFNASVAYELLRKSIYFSLSMN